VGMARQRGDGEEAGGFETGQWRCGGGNKNERNTTFVVFRVVTHLPTLAVPASRIDSSDWPTSLCGGEGPCVACDLQRRRGREGGGGGGNEDELNINR
jgi:hypothetical protein